jgi:hypothetical protein
VNKKYIYFTKRGNQSILLTLKYAKKQGKTKVFLQDQGGWITYEQFSNKLKLDSEYLETDYGLVKTDSLKSLDKDSVLLLSSMPGYFRLQKNMKEIAKKCQEKGALLINDVSGSIGTEAAKSGDLIIGSFGEWKPVDVEYGGFIACDFESKLFIQEVVDFYDELYKKLINLQKRLEFYKKNAETIKADQKQFDIVAGDGINVIIRFNNPEERMKIIDYCKLKGYEYSICPRYIRILEDAICIEVKRL